MEYELIKRARNKDKVAFNKLVEVYKKDLYVVAKAKLNDEADIEDAIQETLFDMYKHMGRLKDERCFKNWMFRILTNNCNDIIRHSKSLFSFYDVEEIERIEDNSNAYRDLEDNHDFIRMLDFLRDDDKEILTLKYSLGFEINEISKIMKMREGTIRMRLSRIKDKLKDKYECN